MEEIPEKGQKFQCASCGHVFRVQKKSHNIDEALSVLKGRLNAWDSNLSSAEEDPFSQDLLSEDASSGGESAGEDADLFSEEIGMDERPEEDSGGAFQMPGTKNGGLKGLVDEITEGGEEGTEEFSDDMIDSLLNEVESGDISPESDFGDIEMPESETGLEENGLQGLEGFDDSFEELLGEASPPVEESPPKATAQKPEAKDDLFSEMDNVFDSLMGEGVEKSTSKETPAEETGSLEDFSFDEPPREETAQPESVDLGSDFDEMFGEGTDVEGADEEKTGAVDADGVKDRGIPLEESPTPSSEDTAAPLPSGSALEDLDSAFGEMFGEGPESAPSVSTDEESTTATAGGGGPAWEENLLDNLMKETEAEGLEDAKTKMIATPPPPGTETPESAEEGMSEEDLWASALQEQKTAVQGEDETTKAAESIAAPSGEDTGPGGDLVSQGDLDQLFAEASGGAGEDTGPTQVADWGGGTESSSGKTEIINQSELDNLWNQALAEQSDTGQEEKESGAGGKPESTGIVSQEELDGLFSGVGKEEKDSHAADQEPTEDLTAQTEMVAVEEEKTSTMSDKGGGEEGGEEKHEGEEEFEFDEELLTDKKKKSLKDKISVAYITGLLPEGKKRYVVLSLVGVLLLGGMGTAGYFGYRHYSHPPIAGKEKTKEIIQEAKVEKESVAPKMEEAVKKEEGPIPEAPSAQEQLVKEQPVKEEIPPPVQTAETAPYVPISEKNSLELGLIMPIQFSPTEMKVLQATFLFETRDHQSYEHLKIYLPIYQELMEKFANEFFNQNFYNEIHYAKDKFKDKLMATFNKEMKREAITRVEVRNFVIDIKEEKKKTEEKKKDSPEGEKHEEQKGAGH